MCRRNFLNCRRLTRKNRQSAKLILNQELPNPELIRLHTTLLRCCQISKSVGITFCQKKIFSESENAAFFGALSRNWNQRAVSLSINDARIQFIQFLLESLCIAVTKSKINSESLFVIYEEIRRLAADWELDCEVLVDVIIIVFCYTYGLKPAEISVQDVDLLEDELCSLLACSTRALISKLNGEQNAQFLANMAPFNVNFWLDEKEPQKMISGNKAAENLIALCNGIVKIDGFTKNPKRKENAKAILRALEAI
ncbi:unnamed protein product [Oikopleura dioica]|uniref:Uncharacterized protein n=1 Tax=Oikopleura dioica TaxID=34765 RepID=E4Y317_OIKDI|nr:unnamed protein product [Oikopleura dioica]